MKKTYIYALLAALLLAVVAIFFFYPDVLEGRVLQQSDMRQGLANGHETQTFEQLTGEKPRWTNSLFSGMPTFQISPSYPANSMLDWISGLYTLWLPSPANLLFGMMLGFFIMLLCMKFKWYTALFGALGWGFSTYFIIIIGAGHIWKFLTLMYIPPTIGGIALCYRGKYLQGMALAALFGSLQLMSNHIQMTYYFVFVVVAMIIGWGITAYKEKKIRQWGIASVCVAVAAVLAVAANSASLYNTYEYSKETIRGKSTALTTGGVSGSSSGADIGYITQWSYGCGETFSLLVPDVRGGASVKPVPDPAKSSLKSIADIGDVEDKYESGEISPEEYAFMSQFPQYFGEQPMTNGPVYVGALLLVLAVLALFCVKGPMKWCLFAVSVLAVLLSWGHNFIWLTELFVNYLPGYGKFRTPSSILVIVEFTVPLLAVMCIREILRDQEFFSRYRYQFYGVFGSAALICLTGWISPSMLAGGNGLTSAESEWFVQQGLLSDPAGIAIVGKISSARLSLVQADSLRSLTFIAIGFALLMLYFKGVVRKRAVLVCFLATAALIDLFSVNRRYIDSENFTDPIETGDDFEMTAADSEILKDKSYYRVLDLDNFGGARSSYFHKTIGGYHAAKLTRYSDLINRQISKGNERVLDMLNAKYAIHEGKVIMRPSAMGNAWFVDSIVYVGDADSEMSGLEKIDPRRVAVADNSFRNDLGNSCRTVAGDSIWLTSYSPDKLDYKYQASGDRVAVFSEIYFPWGWKATVDGKEIPVSRVDYVLRAARLPSGSHDVSFRFDPESLSVTNALGVAAVSVIYVLLAGALAMSAWGILRKK